MTVREVLRIARARFEQRQISLTRPTMRQIYQCAQEISR